MKRIEKTLKNEYLFSVLTRAFSLAMGIVQSILIARYLGPDLKGETAYISSIASTVSIIVTFGIHEAYPFFRKKYGKEAIFQNFVSLTMALYGFLFITAIALAVLLPVGIEIRAAMVLIPLTGYSRIVSYVSLIERPNRRNTWWAIISLAEIVYLIFLWVFIPADIFWGISILAFVEVLRCIVFTILLHTRPRWDKGIPKLFLELLKYGFLPMVAYLMTMLNYRIDVLMLHQYSYITDAMIGIYSLGLSLSDKIVLIPDTLKGVLASKLTKGAGDEEVAKVCRIGFWASVGICILIFVFGRLVIRLFYGEVYAGAYPVILITASGVLAVVFFKIISQYNMINKRQILNLIMLSIAVVTDVILNLVFIPIWGIHGAAFATSIGNIVCGVAFIIYFSRRSKIPVSKMIFIQRSDIQYVKSLFVKKKEAENDNSSDE